MADTTRYAIGIMSGTSLDGIDAACCRIERTASSDPLDYEITVESFVERPYDRELRDRLVRLCDDETGTVDDLCRMNVILGEEFARAAEAVRTESGRSREDIAVIGSHGQTIWHVPKRESLLGTDRRSRSTLQIGDGSVVAARTGIPVVSDFRTRDIASGGHGAPLAPFIDAATFSDPTVSRAIQNIGGIGNCTLLSPGTTRDDVVAFDTGPGNMVIDAVVELLTNGERTYDIDGEMAASESIDTELLAEYIDEEYFRESPPKSTGRERFGHDYARTFIADNRERGNTDEEIVANATALTAHSIADAYERFADPQPDEVLVSGGGARNPTLLGMLGDAVEGSVHPTDEFGIGADEKEAALFALLGITRLDGVANNVPSATGADESVVMGKVSHP